MPEKMVSDGGLEVVEIHADFRNCSNIIRAALKDGWTVVTSHHIGLTAIAGRVAIPGKSSQPIPLISLIFSKVLAQGETIGIPGIE